MDWDELDMLEKELDDHQLMKIMPSAERLALLRTYFPTKVEVLHKTISADGEFRDLDGNTMDLSKEEEAELDRVAERGNN